MNLEEIRDRLVEAVNQLDRYKEENEVLRASCSDIARTAQEAMDERDEVAEMLDEADKWWRNFMESAPLLVCYPSAIGGNDDAGLGYRPVPLRMHEPAWLDRWRHRNRASWKLRDPDLLSPTVVVIDECLNCGEAGNPGHHWMDDPGLYLCYHQRGDAQDAPPPPGKVAP